MHSLHLSGECCSHVHHLCATDHTHMPIDAIISQQDLVKQCPITAGVRP